MSASDEMRRLIDLANTNKLKIEIYDPGEAVKDEGTPFKNFRTWGLNEATEVEEKAEAEPKTQWGVVEKVKGRSFEPSDIKWFDTRNERHRAAMKLKADGKDWHTFERTGKGAPKELDESLMEIEGEPNVLDQMYADHMASMEAPPIETAPVTHLLRPRGGSECGAPCDETNSSPEINEITCPACLAGHEAYEAQFGMSDDGDTGGLEQARNRAAAVLHW